MSSVEWAALAAASGLVLAALTVAFAAAAEVSLLYLALAHGREAGDAAARRTQPPPLHGESAPHLVVALRVLKALAYTSAAGLALWLSLRSGRSWAFGVLPVIGVTLALLLAQSVARGLAMRADHSTAQRLQRAAQAVGAVLSPVAAPLWRLSQAVAGPEAKVDADALLFSEEGLRLLMQVGDEHGPIEEKEKEMIASIFELGETVAREVMVPRIDVVAIEETSSLQEALDLIIEAGHSRIPVYRETIDNVQGVLYAKDLLRPYREGRFDVPITELMRSAYFVPESKRVNELLRELQQLKVHMAIVVDEYGGTAGVVTIEDLLEEIVGDIQDEYDRESPMVLHKGENEYVFDARIDLDEVSQLVGVELPTEETDTLGGFVFSQLGRVPTAGSRVEFGPLTLEVVSVSGRRIQQVRVTRKPEAEEDAKEAQQHSRGPLSALTSMF
ncbi:MAG: hemolysin family protein [Caldilineales bacterium]|nr:hemolysin family protein [Caldilineales bacterium]MDW8319511.1 hemolysin family protein [Anaerolineae bacterium]